MSKYVRIVPVVLIGMFYLSGCNSKQVKSSEASAELEQKYEERIGKATKNDLIEDFGKAEWCKPEESGDGETCRFYKKRGVRTIGTAPDKKSIELYDEVVCKFDGNGILRFAKTRSQR